MSVTVAVPANLKTETVARFIGDDVWYVLDEFIDPAGGKPTGWVRARAGSFGSRWIDLSLAYSVFLWEFQQ